MTQEKTAYGHLVLEQVGKAFEQGQAMVQAVNQVSLNIREGEFVTLLGPSGCGKTTTLRLIAGFEYPTSGRIMLDGKDIGNLPPNKRPMAMVFQSYALFPHLSVFENIAYGLRVRKMREPEINEAVAMVVHMMTLNGLEKRSPNQLSGGQQQRVALARAMVMKPRVLLFDEPLSNLDAKLRTQMRTEIRHLQQRLGITSIYVTHDQVEAMSLSDRIVVMNKGRIEQVATPDEIYRWPATTFVADFIGRANFIETQVTGCQDHCATARLLGVEFKDLPCSETIQAGVSAHAIVRPEAIRLGKMVRVAGAEPEATGGLWGEVKSVAYLGASAEYEVEVAEHKLIVVDPTVRLGGLFREGDQVSVAIDPTGTYLLPRENGC